MTTTTTTTTTTTAVVVVVAVVAVVVTRQTTEGFGKQQKVLGMGVPGQPPLVIVVVAVVCAVLIACFVTIIGVARAQTTIPIPQQPKLPPSPNRQC